MRKFSFVVVRLGKRYFADRVGTNAAALAYFLLFSIFPLLMVLYAALSLIEFSTYSLPLDIFPDAIQGLVQEYLQHLQSTPRVGLLFSGLALTLYFLSRAVRSLSVSINQVYGIVDNRGSVHRVFVSLLMTFGTILLLLGGITMVFSSERLLGWLLGALPFSTILLRFLDIVIAVSVAIGYVLLCYRLLPARKIPWHEALSGAVLSVVVWVAMTLGLSYYVEHLARYDVVYGSISAIIVLMLWLYFTAITLIMGGVLNHIMAHELPTGKWKEGIFKWLHM